MFIDNNKWPDLPGYEEDNELLGASMSFIDDTIVVSSQCMTFFEILFCLEDTNNAAAYFKCYFEYTWLSMGARRSMILCRKQRFSPFILVCTAKKNEVQLNPKRSKINTNQYIINPDHMRTFNICTQPPKSKPPSI